MSPLEYLEARKPEVIDIMTALFDDDLNMGFTEEEDIEAAKKAF